jgi:hypothetical protein
MVYIGYNLAAVFRPAPVSLSHLSVTNPRKPTTVLLVCLRTQTYYGIILCFLLCDRPLPASVMRRATLMNVKIPNPLIISTYTMIGGAPNNSWQRFQFHKLQFV